MERYSVELWSRQGVMLADISGYVKNFRFALQRNQAEDLSFDIDLNAYEDLCSSIGTHPTAILGPYQTDVKIKRNNTYLFGTHVGDVQTALGESGDVISVKAFGYLNLLVDRYVSPDLIFQTDSVDIAWTLIDLTQSQPNGDLGITRGPQQATTVPRDRAYEPRQNVKDGIVNLTKLVDGNFDVGFDENRVFSTYTALGSDRSRTLEFVYPGNVVSLTVPRVGSGALFNKVYGLGSGFGTDQLQSTPAASFDNDSQLNYGVHEEIQTYNSIVEQVALDQNTAGEVNLRKSLLEIPKMNVKGDDFDLNSFGVGDRVTARIGGHPYLATVDGVYRIERIEVAVDENSSEDIVIYFDNEGIIA